MVFVLKRELLEEFYQNVAYRFKSHAFIYHACTIKCFLLQ